MGLWRLDKFAPTLNIRHDDYHSIKRDIHTRMELNRDRNGYEIGPHTDTGAKWLTTLYYLPQARAFSAGQGLAKQGSTAEAIHLLLSGSVGLSMRLPADHRRVSQRGLLVRCGVCEAGGVVGHTSI